MLPIDISRMFYGFYSKKISLSDFENWLYNSDELEKLLPNNEYIELISFDFKKSYWKDIKTFVYKYINWKDVEENNLKDCLTSAINKDQFVVESISKFYDLYCHGYYFLSNLAFRYGLSVDLLPDKWGVYDWNELKQYQIDEIINSFYPHIIDDVKIVLNWLEKDKIEITGTEDEHGNKIFIDKRPENEKYEKMSESKKVVVNFNDNGQNKLLIVIKNILKWIKNKGMPKHRATPQA
jgi:hypothetical protein